MKLRHARAILALPFMVTLVIPTVLLLISRGAIQSAWDIDNGLQWAPLFVGFSLVGLGVFLLGQTIRLFGLFGEGTLAPWDPPKHLVVVGMYRYTRNPMITGVFTILLGEAVFFGSPFLLSWLAFFITAKLIYINFSEEPTLEARFGNDFKLYCQNVPSWIPRRTPWELPS